MQQQIANLLFLFAKGRVSEAQAYPLQRHGSELGERYGLNVQVMPWRDRFEPLARNADVVMLQNRRTIPLDRLAVTVLRELNSRAKLVFVDSHASTYIHEAELFEETDVYLRRNRYRDTAGHRRHYRGGRIFAEYFAGLYGAPLRDQWTHSVDLQYLYKLALGWDIGAAEYLESLFIRNTTTRITSQRPVDVCCRVGVRAHHPPWLVRHRRAVVELLRALGRFTVIASSETIARHAYFDELAKSKIAVSPFGWGEVCWRDFEAIACGCLLVKPSMEHVETYPFRYEDGETYVSVRWDLSDLEEKCRYYLTHEDERLRIVHNAATAYRTYFSAGTYARVLREILALAEDRSRRS